MPRIREIVVDGEICHTLDIVAEKYGGNRMLVLKTLHAGEHLYLGHHIEYLQRHEPEPSTDRPTLDRFLRKTRKIKVKYKSRFPLLASRHITTDFGLYRDQLIYR
jgi:hypothetical protein